MVAAFRSAGLGHRASASRRLLACLLVLLTFMGTSGAWHVGGDDPDCATPTGHDHSAHHERIARPAPTQAPVHCAICHWLQGFRTDSVAGTGIAERDSATGPVMSLHRRPRQFLVRIDVPSRAPPAQFS